jgi:hypothetical protein
VGSADVAAVRRARSAEREEVVDGPRTPKMRRRHGPGRVAHDCRRAQSAAGHGHVASALGGRSNHAW